MNSKNRALISIIVPTYNRADLIMETIDSILNQTYKHIELIVVSDGGTDNTPEVLSKIDDERFQFIMLEQNHGRPAIPRNIGMKKAKGEYIAFCDDDDVWMLNKLERQIKILEENPNVLLTCCNAITFPTNNTRLCVSKWKNQVFSYNHCINTSNPVINSAVLFRKEVINNIGFIDEDDLLKAVEDYDYWLRILKYQNHSIYFDAHILLKYRVFHNKIMDRADREIKTIKRLSKVLNKHLPHSKERIIALHNRGLKNTKETGQLKKIAVKILTKYVQYISKV